MNEKKYTWHRIADNAEALAIESNGLCIADVNGKKITVALHNNTLFACAHKCPHAGGIMAEGFIDAMGNVVCPLHRYKFSLQNGRNVSGEGYYLKTYPVLVNADGVFIGMEEKSGWLGW
jgi:nitrite reductase/ring-hydroxylating ferredoxin subunit